MAYQEVKKLIVPLAGWGTRFLPISKNYPKEMINLVDRPVVQYLIEEAYASGIREVIFVLNKNNDMVQRYFSDQLYPQQRDVYKASPVAQEQLRELNAILRNIKFYHIKRSATFGDGHSILCARSKISPNEPFALSMGDLLSFGKKPFLRQLIEVYAKVNAPVISVERVSLAETAKYGVIAPGASRGRLHEVKGIVEKPGPEHAPSNIAMTGKYILTPAIFSYLALAVRNYQPGNEVRVADALNLYAQRNPLYAYECKGKIHDTGNKLDFLKATVYLGLAHHKIGSDFREFLASLRM